MHRHWFQRVEVQDNPSFITHRYLDSPDTILEDGVCSITILNKMHRHWSQRGLRYRTNHIS